MKKKKKCALSRTIINIHNVRPVIKFRLVLMFIIIIVFSLFRCIVFLYSKHYYTFRFQSDL